MDRSDSDGEFDYDLSGNHMAGNNNNAGYQQVNSKMDDLQIDDNNHNQNNYSGAPKMNDLQVEEDWNFDMPDPATQQPVKTISKRKEMLEAQKNKLSKKKTLVSQNEGNGYPSYQYNKNAESQGSSLYNQEYQPVVNKFDQELDGEIQHESLKKRLEEQRQQQHRMEYVAEDPAQILKGVNQNQNLGHVGTVNMEEAKIERGNYDEHAKKKRKKKKKRQTVNQEAASELMEGEDPTIEDWDEPDNNNHTKNKMDEDLMQESLPDPATSNFVNDDDEKQKKKKKRKSKKEKVQEELEMEEDKDDYDQNENTQQTEKYQQPDDEGEGAQIHIAQDPDENLQRSKSKKGKKEEKNKKKDEILKIKSAFMEKLISPFTEVDELVDMFMNPLPKEVGILECTIVRNKSGFNYWNPKYTLILSDGERFLLNGKKRSGNKTSNYLITLDQDGLKKKGKGFLGKLRANFMGTEFAIFDQGENPTK